MDIRNRKRVVYISILGVLAAFAVLTVTRCVVRAARVQKATEPAPYFPPGAVWTQDISHAPVDPQSSAIIDWLADNGGWGNHDRFQVDFSIRVRTADASTPKVRFHPAAQWYAADSDLVPSIPLPVESGHEGYDSYRCDGGDCTLSIVDRPEHKLYEAYASDYADGALRSSSLAVWDLDRVYPPSGRGDQCGSADAAGFPIAPLLFNADELAAGSINHAIRFVLPNNRIRAHVFVHPATHAGGPRGPELAPPYGAHLRLKANFDLSKLSPPAQVVARALQKYGMFLADGGEIALDAQSDKDTVAKYADLGFDSHSLFPVQVSDFEVLQMPTPIPLTYNCVRNR